METVLELIPTHIDLKHFCGPPVKVGSYGDQINDVGPLAQDLSQWNLGVSKPTL